MHSESRQVAQVLGVQTWFWMESYNQLTFNSTLDVLRKPNTPLEMPKSSHVPLHKGKIFLNAAKDGKFLMTIRAAPLEYERRLHLLMSPELLVLGFEF